MATATKPESKKSAEPKMRKYRLLRGIHVTGSRAKGNQKIYRRGDLIETTTDLLKLNGADPRMQPKFALATGDPYQDQINAMGMVQGDGLDMMNVEELKEAADREGIDISATSSKEMIAAAIRSARNG